MTPLTVLLGPNGSGKSTVFDVFNFLSECFAVGLRAAWDKRGRFQELLTRGSEGRITFELRYRERPDLEPATYHLQLDEVDGAPVVAEEWLRWRRVARNVAGAPYMILSFKGAKGWVISGAEPKSGDKKVRERLDEPDMLAVGGAAITPDGTISPRYYRERVNAAFDVAEHGGDMPGQIAAGSNPQDARSLIDGDPNTSWGPDLTSPSEDWCV